MSFRYVNPGYVNFLKIGSSDTGEIEQIIDPTKSNSGVAFKCSSFAHTLPIYTLQDKEVWLKCEAYIPASSWVSIQIGEIYSSGYLQNGISISAYPNNVTYDYCRNNGYFTLMSGTPKEVGFKFDALNYFFMHLKYGAAESAFLDIQINNKIFDRIQNAQIKTAYNPPKFSLKSYNKQTAYFSNIIFSDEEISPKETIIALPITSNETDMTFDSDTGIYTATAANQTLMSAVNADFLANEYGSDSTVTGIALIGNPAYKTANGLTSLTAQSVENNVATDIETISLDDDTSAMILASQKISNKTIADLQNVKFGWKAGT